MRGLCPCPFHRLGLWREVAGEPVPGEPGGGVEGARLLEQVGGAGHDVQPVLAAQLGPAACSVELDDDLVAAADDQQRRRADRRRAAGPARSGRPPRETTARDVGARASAAAHSAAAAPVLAPK